MKAIHRISFVLLLLVFCNPVTAIQGQTSLEAINLEHGTYEVGFRHYVTTDSTRTYQRIYDWSNTHIHRPVPISVWYPARVEPNTAPMKVLDYMAILKEEEEWEHLPNEFILDWFYYLKNTEQNRKHLTEQANAFQDAEYADGTFPVLVYTPSYQASSMENFALCEYLASHGYVVISSPSRGTGNRWMEGGTTRDMETQAADVAFLIKETARIPIADGKDLAVMGFSFGGIANTLAQMKNKRIKVMVSLDGTERYNYELLTKSAYADVRRLDIPYLHMAQKDIPEVVLQEDNIAPELNYQFKLFDSITNSQAYSYKFHDLTHAYFSTFGVLFSDRDKRQDKSDPEIMSSYKLMSEHTLQFLNAFLKDDTEARTFIDNKPEQNGIREELVTRKISKPKARTFNFRDFNDMAAGQNYENLHDLYLVVKGKHPSLEMPEGALNNLGLQLVFNPERSEKGIAVFQLAIKLYPESANLYDSLAEGYLFIGDTDKAIASFEESLRLDPGNQNAIKRLRQLRP